MKKLIAIISVIAFCSFNTQTEKTFVIKFSEQTINYHWSNLNTVKQIAHESNLPHQQVLFITKSIDSLQIEISKQIVEQNKGK